MAQNTQAMMSSFSNLERRLQEKDEQLDMKEELLQQRELEISLLKNKIHDLETKWKPHSQFLLSNLDIDDLPNYDELYGKFEELHSEKTALEEYKEATVMIFLEKNEKINELSRKLSDFELKVHLFESSQQEILKERDQTKEKLEFLSEKIKKEELEQLEKKKNIETEINREVQHKIDDYIKKSKHREDELHNALTKYEEEVESLKKQLESQEKRFIIKEKGLKKELDTFIKKVDDLEIKKAVAPEEMMKLNNKYTKDIEILKREILQTKEDHDREIQSIEKEKFLMIKRAESSVSDNRKIEEIKQSLQLQMEALQQEIAEKEKQIEELKNDFKTQMIELKEKQELEMNALEMQYKKLKQDDDIYRRKSSLIMKPLINELSAMSSSGKFNFFNKVTAEVSSDSSDKEEEIERLQEELQEAVEKITDIKQENKQLKEEAEVVKQEIEKHQVLFKENMENIEGLRAQVEELQGEKRLISDENSGLRGVLEKLQPENDEFREKIEALRKELAFKEALSGEALRLIQKEREIRDLEENEDGMMRKVAGLLEKTSLKTSDHDIQEFIGSLQRENSRLKEILAIYEGKIKELRQEINENSEKTAEIEEIERKLGEIAGPLEVDDEINRQLRLLYKEKTKLKQENRRNTVLIGELTAKIGDIEVISKGLIKENDELRAEKEVNDGLGRRIRELEEEVQRLRREIQAKMEEIEGVKEEIVRKGQEIQAKNEEIQGKNEEIQGKNEEIQGKNEEIEAKKLEIEAKNQEIEAKKQEIETKKQEIEAKNQEIVAKNQEIDSKIKDIEAKIQEIEAKKEEITTKNEEISAQKEEISAKSFQLEKNKVEIEQKDEEIERKNEEIQRITDEICKQREELQVKEEEISLKNGVISKKNEEIIEKTKEIELKTHEISKKTAEITEKTTEIQSKSAEISSKTQEIANLLKEITEKTQKIDEKSQEIIEKTKEINEKTLELDEKTQEITEKTQEISQKTQELEREDQQLQLLEAENSDLKCKMASILSENDSLLYKLSQIGLDSSDLIEKNNLLMKEIKEKTREIGEIHAENQGLKAENTNLIEENQVIPSLKARIAQLTLDLSSLADKMGYKDAIFKSLGSTLEEMLPGDLPLMSQVLKDKMEALIRKGLEISGSGGSIGATCCALEEENEGLRLEMAQMAVNAEQLAAEMKTFHEEHILNTRKEGINQAKRAENFGKNIEKTNEMGVKEVKTSENIGKNIEKTKEMGVKEAKTSENLDKNIETAINAAKTSEPLEKTGQKPPNSPETSEAFLALLRSAEEIAPIARLAPSSRLFIQNLRLLNQKQARLQQEFETLAHANSELQTTNESYDQLTGSMQDGMTGIAAELEKSQLQNKESLIELSNLKKLIVFYEAKLRESIGHVPELNTQELFKIDEISSPMLRKVRQVQTAQAGKGVVLGLQIERLKQLKERSKQLTANRPSPSEAFRALQQENEALKSENSKVRDFRHSIKHRLSNYLATGDVAILEELKERVQMLENTEGSGITRENYLLKVESFQNNRLKEEGVALLRDLEAEIARIAPLGGQKAGLLLNKAKDMLRNPLAVSESEFERDFERIREKLGQKEAIIADFEEKLKQKEAIIADFNEKIEGKEAIIAELMEKMGQKEGITADLDEKLRQKEAIIAELMEKLGQKEAFIADFDEKLRKKEAIIAELMEKMGGKEAIIAEFHEKLDQKEAIIAELLGKLSQKEAIIVDFDEKLSQNEAIISDFDEKLRKKEGIISDSDEKLRQKEAIIAELHEKLSQKEAIIVEFHEKLSQKESIISEFHAKLSEKATLISDFLFKSDAIFSDLMNLSLPYQRRFDLTADLKRLANLLACHPAETGVSFTGSAKDLVSKDSLLLAEEKMRLFEAKLRDSQRKIADLEGEVARAIAALGEQDPKLMEEAMRQLRESLRKAGEELEEREMERRGLVPKEHLEEAEGRLRAFEGKLKSSEERIWELEREIREAIEALRNSEIDPKNREEALKRLEMSSRKALEIMKEEIEMLRGEMQRVKTENQQKAEAILSLEEENERLCGELAMKKKEMDGKNKEIEEKNKEIHDKNKEIEVKIEEIEGKKEEIIRKNEEIEVKNKQFEDKSEEIARKNKEILMKSKEIEAKTLEIVDKTRQIEQGTDEISRKNEIIRDIRAENEVKTQEIQEKSSQIEAKNKEIEAKNQDIHQKSSQIEAKNHEIEAKFNEIQRKNIEIEGKNNEIEAKNNIINSKNKEISTKIEEIQAKNSEISSKTFEIQAKNAEIEAKTLEIETKSGTIRSQAQEIASLKSLLKSKDSLDLEAKTRHLELEISSLRLDLDKSTQDLNENRRIYAILKQETAEKDMKILEKDQKIAKFAVDLSEKEAFLRKMANELSKKDEAFSSLERELFGKEEAIKQLLSEISTKEQENMLKTQENMLKTQEMMLKIKENEAEIKQNEAKIKETSSILAKTLQKSAENDEKIAKLTETLSENEQIIKKMTESLSEKAEIINKLTQSLSETHLLSSLESERLLLELSHKSKLLSELQLALASKEQKIKGFLANSMDIAALRLELEEAIRLLESMRGTVAEKEAILAQLYGKAVEKDQEISGLKEKLADFSKELLEKEAIFAQFSRKSLEKEQEIKDLQIKIAVFSKELLEKEAILSEFYQKSLENDKKIQAFHEKSLEKDQEIRAFQDKLAVFSQDLLDKTLELSTLKQTLLAKEGLLRDNSAKMFVLEDKMALLTGQIADKNREIEDLKLSLGLKTSENCQIINKLQAAEALLQQKEQGFLLLTGQLKDALDVLSLREGDQQASANALRMLRESYDQMRSLLSGHHETSEAVSVLQARINQITKAFHEYLSLFESLSSSKRARTKALEYLGLLLPLEQQGQRVAERKRTSGRFYQGFGPKAGRDRQKGRSLSLDMGGNEAILMRGLKEGCRTVRKRVEELMRVNKARLELLSSEDATQGQQQEAIAMMGISFSDEKVANDLFLNEKAAERLIESHENAKKSLFSLKESQISLEIAHKTLKKRLKGLSEENKRLKKGLWGLTQRLEETISAFSSETMSSQEKEALLRRLRHELEGYSSLRDEFLSSQACLLKALDDLEHSNQRIRGLEALNECEKQQLRSEIEGHMGLIDELQRLYDRTRKDLEQAQGKLKESLLLLRDKNLTEEQREAALRRLQSAEQALNSYKTRLNQMQTQKDLTMQGLLDLQAELQRANSQGKDYYQLLQEKASECEQLKDRLTEMQVSFTQELDLMREMGSQERASLLAELLTRLEADNMGFYRGLMEEFRRIFTEKEDKKGEKGEINKKLKEFELKFRQNEENLGILKRELDKMLIEMAERSRAEQEELLVSKERVTMLTELLNRLENENMWFNRRLMEELRGVMAQKEGESGTLTRKIALFEDKFKRNEGNLAALRRELEDLLLELIESTRNHQENELFELKSSLNRLQNDNIAFYSRLLCEFGLLLASKPGKNPILARKIADFEEKLSRNDVNPGYLMREFEGILLEMVETSKKHQENELLTCEERVSKLTELLNRLETEKTGFYSRFLEEFRLVLASKEGENGVLAQKIADFEVKMSRNEGNLGLLHAELEELLLEMGELRLSGQEQAELLRERLHRCVKRSIDAQIENKLLRSGISLWKQDLSAFKAGILKEIEDFIAFSEKNSKKSSIYNDFRLILGEFLDVFEDFSHFQQGNCSKNNREVLETVIKTESTAMNSQINRQKGSNNQAVLTLETEEDFLMELPSEKGIEIAQLAVIRENYESLVGKTQEKDREIERKDQEIAVLKTFYQEFYRKIRVCGRKIRDLSRIQAQNRTFQAKTSVFSSNYSPNPSPKLRTSLNELLQQISTIEEDLKNSLQKAVFSGLSKPKVFKKPVILLNDSSNEIIDLEAELRGEYMLENPSFSHQLSEDQGGFEKELLENPGDLGEERVLTTRAKEVVERRGKFRSLYEVKMGKCRPKIMKNDCNRPLSFDFDVENYNQTGRYPFQRPKTHKNIINGAISFDFGLENGNFKERTMKYLLQRPQTMKNANNRPFSFDFDPENNVQRLNQTLTESDSCFLREENTRLSLELTNLEQNFKDKTVWARDLNEKIRTLRDQVLKMEGFQNALCPMVLGDIDPSGFDVFSGLSREQKDIINRIREEIKRKSEVKGGEIGENVSKEAEKGVESTKIKRNANSRYEQRRINEYMLGDDRDLEGKRAVKEVLLEGNKNTEERMMLVEENKKLREENGSLKETIAVEARRNERKVKELQVKLGVLAQKIDRSKEINTVFKPNSEILAQKIDKSKERITIFKPNSELLPQKIEKSKPDSQINLVFKPNSENVTTKEAHELKSELSKGVLSNLQQNIEEKDTELAKWKDRYRNLERKYQEVLRNLQESSMKSQRVSLEQQGNNETLGRYQLEIAHLKQKAEAFERNEKITRLKNIEERARMQRTIKGLKDELIEGKTLGMLSQIDQEYIAKLKKI